MTYVKQVWTPNVTPVDAAHMGHIEDGIALVESEALAVGIPTPVVNGQWIKGVGGAAVWTPIADTDVPSLNDFQRLGGGAGKVITDANTATPNGWYGMNPGGANAPPGSDYIALFSLTVNGPGNVRQIAYAYNNDTVWMRRRQDSTTWTAWKQNLRPVIAAIDGNGGVITGFGVSCTHPSTGIYQVTFAVPFNYPVPAVTPAGSSIVACGQVVSGTQISVILTTPSVLIDGGFALHVYDGG